MIPTTGSIEDNQARIAERVAERVRDLGRKEEVDHVHINSGPFHPVGLGEPVTLSTHGATWVIAVQFKGNPPRNITATGAHGGGLEDAEELLFAHLDGWLAGGEYCSSFNW